LTLQGRRRGDDADRRADAFGHLGRFCRGSTRGRRRRWGGSGRRGWRRGRCRRRRCWRRRCWRRRCWRRWSGRRCKRRRCIGGARGRGRADVLITRRGCGRRARYDRRERRPRSHREPTTHRGVSLAPRVRGRDSIAR
jgi:hypothetical protein